MAWQQGSSGPFAFLSAPGDSSGQTSVHAVEEPWLPLQNISAHAVGAAELQCALTGGKPLLGSELLHHHHHTHLSHLHYTSTTLSTPAALQGTTRHYSGAAPCSAPISQCLSCWSTGGAATPAGDALQSCCCEEHQSLGSQQHRLASLTYSLPGGLCDRSQSVRP
jgi:hypothetical protein